MAARDSGCSAKRRAPQVAITRLASGLPVVARRLPETQRWSEPLVYLYDSPDDFVRQLLAEIAQQGLAPAAGDFAEAKHGVQTLAFVALVLLVALGRGQHLAQLHYVFQTIQQQRSGRFAITAGTDEAQVLAYIDTAATHT